MRAETVSPLVVWVRRLPMKTKVVVLILVVLMVRPFGLFGEKRIERV